MNTFFEIQFKDKTVIWTKYSMSASNTQTRLTPKGVSKLNAMKTQGNLLTFNCTEAELAAVINSVAFFIKAHMDIINIMKPEDMTADSELLLH